MSTVLAIWRVGRRVGRTVYAQTGADPQDTDPLIGVLDTPELARAAVESHNILLATTDHPAAKPHPGPVLGEAALLVLLAGSDAQPDRVVDDINQVAALYRQVLQSASVQHQQAARRAAMALIRANR